LDILIVSNQSSLRSVSRRLALVGIGLDHAGELGRRCVDELRDLGRRRRNEADDLGA
jgi:hypothetical protein